MKTSLERVVIERNVALVSLTTGLMEEIDWESLAVRPDDAAKLLPFLERMELNSIAEELREGTLF